MSQQLKGIFTPNMVPLDAQGEIHEAELRRYLDWLIERGVDGLYPNGSTGEFVRFTPEERRRIVRIVCEQAADRVPVLAGAAEANTRETLRACEAYREYGARAVAIVSPFYYRLSPGGVYAYFREILLNTPIDVTLYNIPLFASPIDVPTVQRLAEFPRLIGIKDSSGDIAHMLRMMAALGSSRPDFAFLAGWEPAMVPMLLMGCQGGTFAMSGIVPEVTRKLYELSLNQRLQEAKRLQLRLIELFDRTVYGLEFPEGVRAALATRGFNFGVGRQPADESRSFDRGALDPLIRSLLKDPVLQADPG